MQLHCRNASGQHSLRLSSILQSGFFFWFFVLMIFRVPWDSFMLIHVTLASSLDATNQFGFLRNANFDVLF